MIVAGGDGIEAILNHGFSFLVISQFSHLFLLLLCFLTLHDLHLEDYSNQVSSFQVG